MPTAKATIHLVDRIVLSDLNVVHSYGGIGRSQLSDRPAVSQMETYGFLVALPRGGELNRNAPRRTRAITAGVAVERFSGFLAVHHRASALRCPQCRFYA